MNRATSAPITISTRLALPISRRSGRARIRKGRKITDRPNSTPLEAIQNQSPRVYRQATPSSRRRLAVNAQKVQKPLSSGTSSGTAISEAGTQSAASTTETQLSEGPVNTMASTIRAGISTAPETAEPTAAERRRKRRTA